MFYGNRIRENFRKGISSIKLFQFKIFIFFAHSGIFCRCLFGESRSAGCGAFFQNPRIQDLNITLVVGTLHGVYELVCKYSVFWQTPITLEPLNEKSE